MFGAKKTERLVQLAGQQVPVALSPAVNGLLYIAHHQVVMVFGQRIQHQRPEILPLQSRSILKLVDHKVVVHHPGFFVHKRRVGTIDNFLDKMAGIGDQHNAFLLANFADHPAQIDQNTKHIQLAGDQTCGIVIPNILFAKINCIAQYCHQLFAGRFYPFFGVFHVPFFHVGCGF